MKRSCKTAKPNACLSAQKALLGVLRQVEARESTKRETIARGEGAGGKGKGLFRTLTSHTV